MQSKLQVHKRTESVLDKILIVSINKDTVFLDTNHNVVHELHKFAGINQVFRDSFLKTTNLNYIAFHDMGTIPYLEDYILSNANQTVCNTEGLHIFCTEQILHTNIKKQKVLLDGQTQLPNLQVDWTLDNNNVWSPELESIDKFVKNNNLTKVTVYVSCKDTNCLYKNYSFNLGRKDPYLNAIGTILHQIKSPKRQFSKDKIKTRFWCGNWGYRPHRHLVTAFASTLDTKYSWGYVDEDYQLLNHLWFDYKKLKHKLKLFKGIQTLKPTSIDISTGSQNIFGNIYDVVLRPKTNPEGPDILEYSSPELYGDTFVSIVNSSTFGEPFPVYDEKPLNAAINYRPFILVGPAGSLELMRSDGFQTFGDFWDESYDNEQDHTKRLEMIFDLLLEINSWSLEKCQNTYAAMQDILQHNYKNINSDLQS